MKICQITSMHDWNDDRIFQRACLGLSRQGYDVHLVATNPNLVIDNNAYPITFHWIKKRDGLKRRVFSSIEAIKIAIAIKADIYHFHDPDLLPFIEKIKKALPNSKVIYDIHENYAGRFQMWGLPKFLSAILYKLFRGFEKYTINKIDGYTAVSDSMLRLFSGVLKPGIVIRNSTDIERLKSLPVKENNTKSEGPIVYTSGTHSHNRDCLQTVQALAQIIQSYPQVKMMFVGRYAESIKEEMLAQAQIDDVTQNLIIDGMLPWEENFNRTAQAFCGCVFYADNPNNRVGIPNRLFEYMYTGIPVVASDFPELRSIITEAKCGILVDSNNPSSIANGIIQLLNNPNEATQMGENGKRAMQEKYGYHIDLMNMVEFYENLYKN